jgi:hypothetical protein
MTRPLFVRISERSHRLLAAYAAEWDLTLQLIVERAIDMILYQTCSSFVVPEWLDDAIASGALELQRCGDEELVKHGKGASLRISA